MKYIIFLSVIICFGCDGMYEDEKKVDISYPVLNTDTVLYNIRDSILDSLDVSINRKICALILVKKPYHLIQWNDGTYGILKKQEGNWYKVKNYSLSFTYTIQDATHFKDSCEAKKDLQSYLDSKITYKIVK